MQKSEFSFWRDTLKRLKLYLAVCACLVPFGVAYAFLSKVGWGKPWVILILLTAGLVSSYFAWAALERPSRLVRSASRSIAMGAADPTTQFYGQPLPLEAAVRIVAEYTCYENLGDSKPVFQDPLIVGSTEHIVRVPC